MVQLGFPHPQVRFQIWHGELGYNKKCEIRKYNILSFIFILTFSITSSGTWIILNLCTWFELTDFLKFPHLTQHVHNKHDSHLCFD